ncbi:MAG: radical SAM protein [Bryobacterales bacterium]|nr:radical SAM protein [Bryobacterales bacterium]
MQANHVVAAWGRILTGYRPFLSLEITKECPLRCPGCYAYSPEHVGDGVSLRQLSDFKGDDLVRRALDLVRRLRPLHVSVIGGEPLVRYRELDSILPGFAKLGVQTQLVTSAVRPIPAAWRDIPGLQVVVSIDGLAPEHDKRRAPATYERILKHIANHQITVHCTITRQMVNREGYLREFCRFWSARGEVNKIWFSIYTPQQGEESEERLRPADRERVTAELRQLREEYGKVYASQAILNGYAKPPASPGDCIFAQVTTCISADLQSRIGPCQFGGKPECTECGCMASAGLAAVGSYRLGGIVPLGAIFKASQKVGEVVSRRRNRLATPAPTPFPIISSAD